MKGIKKSLLYTFLLMVMLLAIPTQASAAVKISKKSVTLIKGQTTTLKITGTKSKVTWSSNKKTVAVVSAKGKVTAKNKGTAKITASVNGKKFVCSVTVENSSSIDKTCIFKGNKVSIYVTKLAESGNSIKVYVYIKNNSSLNLHFCARAYGVNGIMTGNSIYTMGCDVAAGRKANSSFEIEKKFLEENGIKVIKQIDLLMWAYDNDENFKEFDTNQLTIRASAYDGSLGKQRTGKTVYEKNGIKIDRISKKGNSITYAIKNNTGGYFDFDLENLTINGFTSSRYDYDTTGIIVLNKCQAIFTVKIDDDFLSENGISKINKVEFSLNIRPEEDYFKDWNTELIRG